MHLARAQQLAEKVVLRLSPFCEQIEIAGSIRRRRDWVNDIDLVILPKSAAARSDLQSLIRGRCSVVTEGPQNCIYRMPLYQPGEDIQLDIFFARPAQRDLLQTMPGNYGTLLLCRTGSKEHNIHLIGHAKRIGLEWNPQQGVFDGEGYCLASETEADVLRALQLDWIPPEKRER